MGVNRKDYIIYGWKLPYNMKDKDGNKIDPYDGEFVKYNDNENEGEITLIEDGMCGEYMVFGYLVKAYGSDTDWYEGWGFAELDTDAIDKAYLETLFDKLFGHKDDMKPKLFIFSHYT